MGADTSLKAAFEGPVRYLEVVLAALVPLAILPFATVHPGWRSALALLAGVVGLAMALRGLSRRSAGGVLIGTVGGMSAAAVLGGLVFLPVGPGLRRLLQPGIGDVIVDVAGVAGAESLPLALDAHRGLMEWGITLCWMLVVLGAALVVRNSRRAARAARVCVGAGVLLVALVIAHRADGADHIWWISDVPGFSRDPFFGTFVNPNHGGIFCAALAPLALAGVARDRGASRSFNVLALVVLAAGVFLAGSRGAILCALAAMLPMVWLVGGRAGRLGLGASIAAVVVGVVYIGPVEFLRRLSDWLVPGAAGSDVLTGRGEIYADTVSLLAAAPFAGLGPHGFDEGLRVLKSTPTFSYTTHAHQELLQLLVEHGVVLGAVWLIALAVAVGQGFRHSIQQDSERRRLMLSGWLGSLCAIGAACVFTFPLRIGAIELLASLSLGVVLGLSPTSERGPGGRESGLLRKAAIAVFVLALVGVLAPWALEDSPRSDFGDSGRALVRGHEAMEGGTQDAGWEAADWYRLALRRKTLDREPLQHLSRALLMAGDIDGAVAALELATVVDPTLPWAWRDLARLQRRLGDYELSRESYRRMLWCDLPDDERARHVAEAMQGPGDIGVIATAVLPDRGDVLALGARLLEKDKRVNAAEERFARAAELEARYGAHHGSFLLRQDRDEEALAAATRAPEGCFALEVQATAHFKLGHLEDSGELFSRALGQCSDDEGRNRRVRIGIARVRMAQGDPKGRENLEKLVDEDPSDVQLLRVLAVYARQQKHRTLLTSSLERIVATGEARPREVRELDRLKVGLPLPEAMDLAQVDTELELPAEEASDNPRR